MGWGGCEVESEEGGRGEQRPGVCLGQGTQRAQASGSVGSVGQHMNWLPKINSDFQVPLQRYYQETAAAAAAGGGNTNTLGSKVAYASVSGLGRPSMSASMATVTAACCSPASRFFTPAGRVVLSGCRAQ